MNSDHWLKDLYDENYASLYRLAYNRLRPYIGSADVQDVLQEVFIRAFQKDIFSHPNPSGWLIKATIHVCDDYIRSSARRETRQRKHYQQQAPRTVPFTDPAADALDIDAILLHSFSDSDRTLIRQYFFQDLPIRHIAQSLNVSENVVRVRIHRIRKKFKEIL